MDSIREIGDRALACAVKRGKIDLSWDYDKKIKAQRRAILEEAEELVSATFATSKHVEYSEIVEELADVFISASTLCAILGIPMEEVIEKKMKYNETREG